MNCRDVKEMLSAYHDGELDADLQSRISDHLDGCAACRTMREGFERLSQMAGALTDPIPPERLWERIETELQGQSSPLPLASQSAGSHQRLSRDQRLWVTLAAVIVVAATIGLVTRRAVPPDDEHSQFVAVFSEYLQKFQHDPDAAQEFLLANYEHHEVTPEEAIDRVGYRPAVAAGLPSSYTIASTHVMKMPCCTCVQCLCRRSDGTSLATFEHNDAAHEWFGGRPAITVNCQSKLCALVELPDSIAATWPLGKRQMTVIGAQDLAEVNDLVAWFDEQREAGQP